MSECVTEIGETLKQCGSVAVWQCGSVAVWQQIVGSRKVSE